jgi:hypothetical protein
LHEVRVQGPIVVGDSERQKSWVCTGISDYLAQFKKESRSCRFLDGVWERREMMKERLKEWGDEDRRELILNGKKIT